jgi:hypothetical protein
MKKNNEYLIYGGLAIISIVGLIFLFKEDKPIVDSETKDETKLGDTTEEQKVKDPALSELMKLPNWQNRVLNKKLYTKVGGANIRTQAFVNNGFFNNIYGTIPTKDVELGVITKVIAKAQSDGMAWFGIKLSKPAYNIIQSEKIITRDLWENIPPLLWIREDVVKLA